MRVRRFFITDLLPTAAAVAQHAPFQLLSLGGKIAQALLGYDLTLFT